MEEAEELLQTPAVELDIRDIQGMVESKASMFAAYGEAARVMLWKFHNQTPIAGSWEHDGQPRSVTLTWEAPTFDMIIANGNELDATEEGAYAIAIAIAAKLNFRVIGRVYQGSGADLLMVPVGEPANDFYRLEVSGIARDGQDASIRLDQKLRQLRDGDYRRPGVAVVARFETLEILSGCQT